MEIKETQSERTKQRKVHDRHPQKKSAILTFSIHASMAFFIPHPLSFSGRLLVSVHARVHEIAVTQDNTTRHLTKSQRQTEKRTRPQNRWRTPQVILLSDFLLLCSPLRFSFSLVSFPPLFPILAEFLLWGMRWRLIMSGPHQRTPIRVHAKVKPTQQQLLLPTSFFLSRSFVPRIRLPFILPSGPSGVHTALSLPVPQSCFHHTCPGNYGLLPSRSLRSTSPPPSPQSMQTQ